MEMRPPICDFGWKPVDASLKGVDGNTHSILEHAGPNGLVVAFICNHCPYVVSVIERIVKDAQQLKAHGIGFVAICSNDAKSYPQDSFANMKLFASQHNFGFAYLHDESQQVAKSWDAVCTPDFFGFNGDLALQYRGRLDEGRMGAVAQGVRRELVEAMELIAKTGNGPQEQIASMGCSIKWKPE